MAAGHRTGLPRKASQVRFQKVVRGGQHDQTGDDGNPGALAVATYGYTKGSATSRRVFRVGNRRAGSRPRQPMLDSGPCSG